MNGSAMVNPSTMMKKNFLVKNNIHYQIRKVDEDHALWMDVYKSGGKFANLEETLLIKRKHDNNIIKIEEQSKEPLKTSLRKNFLSYLYPNLTSIQSQALARIMEKNAVLSRQEAILGIELSSWIIKNKPVNQEINHDFIKLIMNQYANNIRKLL
jgi:hypothetical protein